MNPPPPQQHQPALTSFFHDGEGIRSRSVSGTVLAARLDVPAPPERLVADWEKDIALALQPGDVEPLHLPRTRLRWPEHRLAVQAVQDWTHTLGLGDLLAGSDIALMACRGARYHHDGAQYGGAVFCNLFLSDDRGLDVHFPGTDDRIPLTRGTALIFDTCQPHAVIDRQSAGFDVSDFPPERDCSQVFLTWELPVQDARVADALGIVFDVNPGAASLGSEGQVWWQGAPAEVEPGSGRWRRPDQTRSSL